MSDVTLLTANLAVVVLESLLYGIYAILASCALYFMVSGHRERLSGTSWFSRSNLLSPVALGALALFITVSIVRVGRFFSFFNFNGGIGRSTGFSMSPASLLPFTNGMMDQGPEYSIPIYLISRRFSNTDSLWHLSLSGTRFSCVWQSLVSALL
jgi:hypothetical protein